MIRIVMCLLVAQVGGGFSGAESATEQEVLMTEISKNYDAMRHPEEDFSVDMTLTVRRDGQVETRQSFRIFARREPGERRHDAVFVCREPEGERGKFILRRKNEFWLCDTRAERPVRLNSTQMRHDYFMSDAFYTLVGEDYKSTFVGSGEVGDVQGNLQPAILVRFEARENAEAAGPPRIQLWASRDDRLPLKAEYHSAEGKLLRTGFYTTYRTELGFPRAILTYVVSGQEKGLVTVVEFENFRSWTAQSGLFNPDTLAQYANDPALLAQ